MPINRTKFTPLPDSNKEMRVHIVTHDLQGELDFRDYFAQFAVPSGIMSGYTPSVELIYPHDMLRGSAAADDYRHRVESEIIAYFNGGAINGGHHKARYKPYQGDPYYVSNGGSGIFIFFVSESDRDRFVRAMHGSFAVIRGADDVNAVTTFARAVGHGYQPENEKLRALYDHVRETCRAEAMLPDYKDFPGVQTPQKTPDFVPQPGSVQAQPVPAL